MIALALAALAFGVTGWLIEWAWTGAPRYSALFRGRRVPWLPIYSAGGILILSLEPIIGWLPLPVRGLIYAGALSLLEFAGCIIDRKVLHACSWDYTNEACAVHSRGCTSVPHAAAWGLLGLAVEAVG